MKWRCAPTSRPRDDQEVIIIDPHTNFLEAAVWHDKDEYFSQYGCCGDPTWHTKWAIYWLPADELKYLEKEPVGELISVYDETARINHVYLEKCGGQESK